MASIFIEVEEKKMERNKRYLFCMNRFFVLNYERSCGHYTQH